MTTPAIMVLGTGSHVGKSLLTAALCRIFADAGINVAPFKSQNMSLNSAATVEGLEIGRAQALQAEAARIPASVHMNPILLKPAGDMTSQIVVRGKIWGKLSAADYHLRRVHELLPLVRESYETLAARHDLILLEGAGSPAEINLKQHDIVNMRMAHMAGATCLLVGDIDRGGVFASLLGTVLLLEPEERACIRGVVINKFRGDVTLLTPGLRMLEDKLGIPCLGVVPWLHELALDEEDSLGLPSGTITQPAWYPSTDPHRPLRIAVIAFPTFSNFTDLDALQSEPSVELRLCRRPAQLAHADLILLPGSKQTADDLLWLEREGLAAAIRKHATSSLIIGICGGMQMLGTAIEDPQAIEHAATVPALGLLPFTTRMEPVKVTRQTTGTLSQTSLFGQPIPQLALAGYEIHVGTTLYAPRARPFAHLQHQPDGCISDDGRIFGTYLHGLFDDDATRHAILAAARTFHHLAPAETQTAWHQAREQALNRLAQTVQKSLDMNTLFEWAHQSPPHQSRVPHLTRSHS